MAKIAELEKIVGQQAVRIADLEKRLNRDSSNSSMPPSSDGLKKPGRSAERDLRMVKCKQKISGGFRTSMGAEYFARIKGFISTLRKQELSIINSIEAAFSGTIPVLSGR